MFLSKEYVMKKLNVAKKKMMPDLIKHVEDAKKDVASCDNSFELYYKKLLKSAENKLKGFKVVGGIPFKPRSGKFYTAKCDFDPSTGRAHSYDWYILGDVIKGQYVVNSFGYSHSTSGHVWMLRSTLKMLGVKYVELEAPSGLQNLESSRDLYLHRIGAAIVAMKYGSKKCNRWRQSGIRDAEKQLKLLATLGIKTTLKMRNDAIVNAERERDAKLKSDAMTRDARAVIAYQRAVINNDLKAIVKFHAQNKRRVARGLPELKAA